MFFEDLRRWVAGHRLFDLGTVLAAARSDATGAGGGAPPASAAGAVERAAVVRDLYRWRTMGRVIRWRRELYSIASRYGGPQIHPLELACAVHRKGYVSLVSALIFHGVVDSSRFDEEYRRGGGAGGRDALDSLSGPGHRRAARLIATLDPPGSVSVVGSSHPGTTTTPLGEIRRHRIHGDLMWGYRGTALEGFESEVAGGRNIRYPAATIALPHKALMDLWYLWPRGWTSFVYERLDLRADLLDHDALYRAFEGIGRRDSMRRALHALRRYAGWQSR